MVFSFQLAIRKKWWGKSWRGAGDGIGLIDDHEDQPETMAPIRGLVRTHFDHALVTLRRRAAGGAG
ncbi:MAG: hypothetical protein ABIF71_11150, partial [Planctomycetota bacterium]